MKRCVINYITRNAWHPFGQKRLEKSLKRVGFDGDIFLFDDVNFKCDSHSKTPYAFKLFCLKEVEKKGYDSVLWLDASFWAIQKIDGLFEMIEKEGHVLQSSGYPLGQWSSDNALAYMNMSREEAFDLTMFSGGLTGYNLACPLTKKFIDEYYKYAIEGIPFRGKWTNEHQEVSKDSRVRGHRHDMVVGTILAHRMGLRIIPNNTVFSYYGWYEKYKKEMDLSGVYFVCEGGMRKI